jgi:drug/metabolite transporter (DMT)-like permease
MVTEGSDAIDHLREATSPTGLYDWQLHLPGRGLASVGLLYNQENAFKAGLYLFLALAGMSGGFYFYFRALRVLSARRRVLSYPAAHRPKP